MSISDDTSPLKINHPVLVVDDEPVSRALLVRILRDAGAYVLQAGDGRQAIDLISDTPVGLIFMDCMMPELDGFETTRELRRQGCTTPIVAVTGACNEDQCSSAGMDYFISKPVTKADIKMACQFLALEL